MTKIYFFIFFKAFSNVHIRLTETKATFSGRPSFSSAARSPPSGADSYHKRGEISYFWDNSLHLLFSKMQPEMRKSRTIFHTISSIPHHHTTPRVSKTHHITSYFHRLTDTPLSLFLLPIKYLIIFYHDRLSESNI